MRTVRPLVEIIGSIIIIIIITIIIKTRETPLRPTRLPRAARHRVIIQRRMRRIAAMCCKVA